MVLCVTRICGAEPISVYFAPTSDAFPLAGARIVTDAKDDKLIGKVADMFSGDLERVTGRKGVVSHRMAKRGNLVFGTTRSSHVRTLVSRGLIDLSPISGGYERFIIANIGDGTLAVVGNDPRGAAYGLLTLSEKIGVSPWYWWGDVPVDRHDEVFVRARHVSRSPSVRYRGIFINDEDWGLYEWAARNFEPETGSIGPKTYRKVCELLLRLRCNMLAPAMHLCSHTFYSHPENKVIADEYGIMITTSHCEPLLFNNLSSYEWRGDRDGEWDYGTNRETIYRKLDARVKEASPYENIYTMGLRGLHDEGMRGNYTMDDRVSLLEKAVDDQRGILSRHIARPIDSIPQILIPYKEVQHIYEHGMKVPGHITLVWPDDNFGYMKMLSNPEERKRPGRSGVYYHISYLGVPHDYLWLSTTPPQLMYEEMKKAYDTGADRYWLLNVGDIKPMELSIQLFFDMAWDFSRFSYDNVNDYQADYLAGIFGREYRDEFQHMLDEYYRLAWSRKPEHMGWEREWDSPEFTGMKNTEFSFENYNDAKSRLADYAAISESAEKIMAGLPERLRPAFFEMVGYPVVASAQMNRKFLMAQLNQELADSGEFGKANWAGEEAVKAFRDLERLTRDYNDLLGGKWRHMMSIPKGVCALYQDMPKVNIVQDAPEEVDLAPVEADYRLEGCLYVPVDSYSSVRCGSSHTVRMLKGLGFDWKVLQLGEVTQPHADASAPDCLSVDYGLPAIDADSVRVVLYTVPRFPLCKGADASFGISVDGVAPRVINNIPLEQSRPWKDDVIRNAMVSEETFAIDRGKSGHRLTVSCGAPGLMVQRILIDWGGLKKTYVGPSNPSEHISRR